MVSLIRKSVLRILLAIALAAISLTAGGFASTPRPAMERAEKPPPPVPVIENPKYVALGSSYAAGMEEPTKAGKNCLKSPDRYPLIVAEHTGNELIDKTCSGATTAHLLYGGGRNQPTAQISAVSPDTSIVTVTIGSNDVQYMGRISYLYCQPKGCAPKGKVADSPNWAKLTEAIATVVNDINLRAPAARIVYVGYPKPVSTSCLPGTEPSGLTIDQFHDTMVNAIKAGLGSADYIDPVTFIGHDLCSSDPWFVPRGEYGAYHPNGRGREELADLVSNYLDGNPR